MQGLPRSCRLETRSSVQAEGCGIVLHNAQAHDGCTPVARPFDTRFQQSSSEAEASTARIRPHRSQMADRVVLAVEKDGYQTEPSIVTLDNEYASLVHPRSPAQWTPNHLEFVGAAEGARRVEKRAKP